MDLIINGQHKSFLVPLKLTYLLSQLKLDPERVVIELNREILTADKYVDIELADGDTLELIQFVGGG